MNRITENMLKNRCNHLNAITGNPQAPWNNLSGQMKGNVGNYHIDGAYGGVQLVQVMNEEGGIHTFFGGHVSKRELYGNINAFINGVNSGTQ